MSDTRGRAVGTGVAGVLTARGVSTGVRAQQLENGTFFILGCVGRNVMRSDGCVDLDLAEKRLRDDPEFDDAAVITKSDSLQSFVTLHHGAMD